MLHGMTNLHAGRELIENQTAGFLAEYGQQVCVLKQIVLGAVNRGGELAGQTTRDLFQFL